MEQVRLIEYFKDDAKKLLLRGVAFKTKYSGHLLRLMKGRPELVHYPDRQELCLKVPDGVSLKDLVRNFREGDPIEVKVDDIWHQGVVTSVTSSDDPDIIYVVAVNYEIEGQEHKITVHLTSKSRGVEWRPVYYLGDCPEPETDQNQVTWSNVRDFCRFWEEDIEMCSFDDDTGGNCTQSNCPRLKRQKEDAERLPEQ